MNIQGLKDFLSLTCNFIKTNEIIGFKPEYVR